MAETMNSLGRMLLADAVKRTVAAGETVTMHALIVDAVNDDAKRFYERGGFVLLTDDPMHLFLPLSRGVFRRYGTVPFPSWSAKAEHDEGGCAHRHASPAVLNELNGDAPGLAPSGDSRGRRLRPLPAIGR